MDIDNPEIRKPLDQIVAAVQADKSLLTRMHKTELYSTAINAENLSDLVGNHLFDDAPRLFGITRDEGVRVRGYLTGLASVNYEFVLELHAAYPQIMGKERPEFMERVNTHRARLGLGHISL